MRQFGVNLYLRDVEEAQMPLQAGNHKAFGLTSRRGLLGFLSIVATMQDSFNSSVSRKPFLEVVSPLVRPRGRAIGPGQTQTSYLILAITVRYIRTTWRRCHPFATARRTRQEPPHPTQPVAPNDVDALGRVGELHRGWPSAHLARTNASLRRIERCVPVAKPVSPGQAVLPPSQHPPGQPSSGRCSA